MYPKYKQYYKRGERIVTTKMPKHSVCEIII